VLAHSALDGLATPIRTTCPRRGSRGLQAPQVVGDADELVILHAERTLVARCQAEVTPGLQTRGFTVQPSQTRIVPTLARTPEPPGCAGLGVHMPHHLAGPTPAGQDGRGRLHGFQTSMTPSPPAIRRHQEALRTTSARHQPAQHETLRKARHPLVRGWRRSEAPVKSARVCQKLDHTRSARLRGWAVSRHPHQSQPGSMRQDGRVDEGQGWTFPPPHPRGRLVRQAPTRHQRHGPVQGTRRPDDGDGIDGRTR
jgi:hypothetical protein